MTGRASTAFHVSGLDCAEEIAALRASVGPVVGGAEYLGFDLLAGKMTVHRSLSAGEERAVARAVAAVGLRSRPWRDRGAPERTLADRLPALLCVASGVLLVLGLAADAWRAGTVPGGGASPPAAIALYGAAMLIAAWRVMPKALAAARALRPDMNLLMTVAVAGAAAIGEWLEAAAVAFLFCLALELERWSIGRARRAIGALLELAPRIARVIERPSGTVRELPVDAVPVGALIKVRPGERIPLDGRVAAGRTAVDQSAITGESIPVERAAGDPVFAGTVNGDGAIDVEVERPAADSALAGIIQMVEEARSRRAPVERWVERFARIYTPIMMALALAVAILPPLLLAQPWQPWIYRALVLLVIACPCALVISTPVAIVAGLTAAARAGVLIKGGGFLELAAGLKALAFDKTGTLTHGRARVQRLVPLDGHSEDELLARAAALEADSAHPLAAAVLAEARRRGVPLAAASGHTVLPGMGAEGMVDGRRFWIGNHRLLEERGAETPEVHRLAEELEDAAHSLLAVGNDRHVCGLISVADDVRPEAARALSGLREAGVEHLVLITGDNFGTARAVAAAVGADAFLAELLPEDKVAAVRDLERRHGVVAMVGDGVNDAPALAAAAAGIAMGVAGSDAAIETADIALMSDDLERLPWLIHHARRTRRIVWQNIAFALTVKAAFVLLTAAGVASLWLAIAADMGASLLVIGNGLRLLDGRSDR